MVRVAIYVRVSSDQQAKEGDSIPAQLDALRKYVDSRPDAVIAGEYIDDGVSGQKCARDALQALLDAVKAGNVDLIAFTKLDRWFRSVRHYTATQETLDKHGVAWLAIWEPIYDTTTPAGRLIVNQMMSIAQFEAENTGQRIRSVFAYKVQKGEAISGNVPFGYAIKDKRLVLTDAAPVVRDMFRLYSRNGSIADCVRFLDAHGHRCAKHSVKTMLRNEKYIGAFRGNPSYCPPIVDRELFEDCGRKLGMNIKSSQKYAYIFSGLLKCAECGASLAGCVERKNRGTRIDVYRYYRCPKHYQRGLVLCENQKHLYESTLERYLFANIRELAAQYKISYQAQAEKHSDNAARIAAIEKKMERLKDLYVNDLINLDEYKRDKSRYEEDIAALTQENALEPPDFSALDKLSSMPLESIYVDFSNEEKRYFWRSFIRRIEFGRDKSIRVIFL